MATVRELRFGDVVVLEGMPVNGMHITNTDHPVYPGLRLVVWKLSNDAWSFDALHPDQWVGDVEPSTPKERMDRARQALEG